VILLDANLLIYAVDSDSPRHQPARRWLERTLSGTTAVGIPWVVVLAFLRLTTRAGILRRPLALEPALTYVDEWLAQPFVTLAVPGPRHWPILRNLLRHTGVGGNLTSDAHVAALAIELGASVYSTDHDFARFPGVEHVDPLG
jgi:uncharacterized protein